MRRMHLDRANAELGKSVDFGAGIGNGSREYTAKRDEPVRRRAAVFGTPVVHLRSKANNCRRDVVDESRAFYAKRVQECQEGFGVGAVAFHVRVVIAPLLYQL